MTLIEILVLALATYRLVRLVTTDILLERFRIAVEGRSQLAGYLVSCDWCFSMWVAPVTTIVGLRLADVTIVRWAGVALALSAVVGLIAAVEQRLDR